MSLGKEAPDSQSPSGGNDKDQLGVPGDKGHMGLKCFHLVMMMGGSRVVERHTGRKVLILSLIEALVTACPCSNVAEPRRDNKPRTFPSEAGCTASSSFSRAHRGPGAEQQRCPGAPGAPRSQGPSGPPQGDPCSAACSFGASAFACYLCSGSLLVSERLPQLQPLC